MKVDKKAQSLYTYTVPIGDSSTKGMESLIVRDKYGEYCSLFKTPTDWTLTDG